MSRPSKQKYKETKPGTSEFRIFADGNGFHACREGRRITGEYFCDGPKIFSLQELAWWKRAMAEVSLESVISLMDTARVKGKHMVSIRSYDA